MASFTYSPSLFVFEHFLIATVRQMREPESVDRSPETRKHRPSTISCRNLERGTRTSRTATGRWEVKLDRVLARPGRDAANRRLAKRLLHERPYLFTFLYCPGLDATNNVSERAIRALIGARKNWGGNRTERGSRAQKVLTSILQTAKQQGKKPFEVLVELLCSNDPHKILDLCHRLQTDLRIPRPVPRRVRGRGQLNAIFGRSVWLLRAESRLGAYPATTPS